MNVWDVGAACAWAGACVAWVRSRGHPAPWLSRAGRRTGGGRRHPGSRPDTGPRPGPPAGRAATHRACEVPAGGLLAGPERTLQGRPLDLQKESGVENVSPGPFLWARRVWEFRLEPSCGFRWAVRVGSPSSTRQGGGRGVRWVLRARPDTPRLSGSRRPLKSGPRGGSVARESVRTVWSSMTFFPRQLLRTNNTRVFGV